LVEFIKGKVTVELSGSRLTPLINEAMEEEIVLGDIRFLDEERIRLTVLLPDFFRLVKILRRRSGIRMRIISKQGLPFLLSKMYKRKFFAAGVVLFVFLLMAMSSFVWKVEVEGNERIPEEQILTYAREAGVFPGQLKFRVPDGEEIQHRLAMRLPQASWVGFRLEGTRAVITVVEKRETEEERERSPGPVHLVARRSALIYDMRVEQGKPVVQVNDMVKKGQLLVSGIYGNPEEDGSERVVGAKGKVWGEVWYDSDVVVPLEQKRKVYTGNRDRGYYPYVASRIIRLPFLYPVPFKDFETVERAHVLRLFHWRLPIGWVVEERLEMKWIKRRLTPEEAIRLGKERARADVREKIGPDGRILLEKVLQPRVDSGKVYMKVHFDVIENIAVSQPILQGE
jgi:similar to stage IV sporulation protein